MALWRGEQSDFRFGRRFRGQMTEHYVTLFDFGFLPQGLALFRSLCRHGGDFKLWVVCMDREVASVLTELNDPRIGIIPLSHVETREMIEARANRTFREYCWTLTPFTPGFVFDVDPSATRATYVDADIWLIASPTAIFGELERSRKAILLTEHAYSPEYDSSLESGRFCVQFMPFVRGTGDALRESWVRQTLARCSADASSGVLGDQGYLNDWPETHPELVHVLEEKGLALGPWNAQRYPWSEAAFYHFAGLRLLSSTRATTGLYVLPQVVVDAIYRPYLLEIADIVTGLRESGVKVSVKQAPSSPYHSLRRWGQRVKHRRQLSWSKGQVRSDVKPQRST